MYLYFMVYRLPSDLRFAKPNPDNDILLWKFNESHKERDDHGSKSNAFNTDIIHLLYI